MLQKSRSDAGILPPIDRRDRHPGTHFAAELGAPPKRRRKLPPEKDPHVDEDLGCCEFGVGVEVPRPQR